MSPAPPRLRASTPRASALSPATRDAMWRLFERYYGGVTRDVFDRDLASKHHVILLHDPATGALAGFSTLEVLDRRIQGRRVLLVYSGDTIVDQGHWGGMALQRAFLAYVMRVWLRRPHVPVYWYLISKGYKTYLLLSRNFPEHWPRRERATPPWQAAILDAVATEKFGRAWVPAEGVLRFDEPQGHLRTGVAPIDADELDQPDIRFFAERNPGHASGDELCCLGRVELALWTSHTAKLLRRGAAQVASRLRAAR